MYWVRVIIPLVITILSSLVELVQEEQKGQES